MRWLRRATHRPLEAAQRPQRRAWEPNPGWRPKAPSYLPSIVASRQLQLRVNHSSRTATHRRSRRGSPSAAPRSPTCSRAGIDGRGGLVAERPGRFRKITFPPLSDRQKQITRFALKYIGYPYVWAGEYPTKNSPYGYQKAGGFDCSGFAFYIMKMKFGYPITVNERGGGRMAAKAKPASRVRTSPAATSSSSGTKVRNRRQRDLPRRPLSRQRLVHPLDGLERRRDAGLARPLDVLQDVLRLGSAGAHGGQRPPCPRPSPWRAPAPHAGGDCDARPVPPRCRRPLLADAGARFVLAGVPDLRTRGPASRTCPRTRSAVLVPRVTLESPRHGSRIDRVRCRRPSPSRCRPPGGRLSRPPAAAMTTLTAAVTPRPSCIPARHRRAAPSPCPPTSRSSPAGCRRRLVCRRSTTSGGRRVRLPRRPSVSTDYRVVTLPPSRRQPDVGAAVRPP